MTIVLEDIFINNTQLFVANVYDVDGVTPLTPLSCVCDVWNQDTGTQVITNQSGTVGAGYAQYNWSGTATAGRYEAVLTVTISFGVIKSEHFAVRVLTKPPAIGADFSLGNLVQRLMQEVPAADGVPTPAQYEQAVRDAVRDFSRRCGLAKISSLAIVPNTATYTLPADFLSMILLESPATADGVVITNTGLIPISADWEETHTIVNQQITFYPTPAYSMTREFKYKAGWVLDINDEYSTMGEEEAQIVLMKAQAICNNKIANAMSADGVLKYSLGAVSVDKGSNPDMLVNRAYRIHGEYVQACEAYNGRTLMGGML